MATSRKPTVSVARLAPDAVAAVASRLAVAIPQPRCELDHADPWTLLIATILSAQSTDRTVNTVTPLLFQKWPTPQALAAAPREEVEAVVHRTGFYRNKAKAIQGCSLVIHEQYRGEVPRTMAELVELPGVARKTANVVLGVAFGLAEGIVVDTHVMRVSQRLGLTSAGQADKVESDLCAQFPQDQWNDTGHRLLLLGRYLCLAKGPRCEDCPLSELCASRAAEPLGTWQERAARVQDLVTASKPDIGPAADGE